MLLKCDEMFGLVFRSSSFCDVFRLVESMRYDVIWKASALG